MQNLRLKAKITVKSNVKIKCSTSLKRSGHVESKIEDLEEI